MPQAPECDSKQCVSLVELIVRPLIKKDQATRGLLLIFANNLAARDVTASEDCKQRDYVEGRPDRNLLEHDSGHSGPA